MTKKSEKTNKKGQKTGEYLDIPPEVADFMLESIQAQKDMSLDKFPSQVQLLCSFAECEDEDARRVYQLLSILLLAKEKFGKGGDVMTLPVGVQVSFLGNQVTAWMDNYQVSISSLKNFDGESSGILQASVYMDKKKVQDRKTASSIMGFMEHVLSKLPAN